MPKLTPEQIAARQKAIEDNKQSLGLKKAGIDANATVTDVRSVYSNEPQAPGTAAEDSTGALNLVVTAQMNSSDSLTAHHSVVKRIRS